MTTEATTTTPAVDAATAVSEGLSARTEAFIDSLSSESDETPNEAPAAAPETATEAPQDEDRPTDPQTPEARREARKAKLQELREKEQVRLSQKQERGQLEALQREVEELRAKAAVVPGVRIEDIFGDPAKLIEAFEKHADADRLVELIRARASGETPKTGAPKLDIDKLKAELQEQLRTELQRELTERATHEQQARQQLEAKTNAERTFLGALQEQATDFPLTEAFRARYGDEQVIAMAHTIGPSIPDGATYTDLLDAIEEQFQVFQSLGKPAEAKPEQTAKAKAQPLRNAAAGTRTAVDEEGGPLTYEERVARALATLGE